MIVDDEDSNIVALQKLLENIESDTQIEGAHNATKAFDIIQRRFQENSPHHLIFVDVNMPVLDGFKSSKKIISIYAG